MPKNYLSVARTCRFANWSFTTTNVSGFWRYETCALNSLSNVNEYTNLFDEYRITGVKYRYVPCYDSLSALDSTNGSTLPVTNAYEAHVSVDASTGTQIPSATYNIAALNGYLEEANRNKIYRGGKEFSVFYRPRVLEDHNTNTASKTIPFPWTRTTASSVVARGHHMFIWGHNGTSVVGLNFEVYLTVYVQFRGAK